MVRNGCPVVLPLVEAEPELPEGGECRRGIGNQTLGMRRFRILAFGLRVLPITYNRWLYFKGMAFASNVQLQPRF